MEDRILKYLLAYPGAKAKDIAGALLGDRQDTRPINQCLFNKLQGLVARTSKSEGWYLTSKGKERVSPSPTPVISTPKVIAVGLPNKPEGHSQPAIIKKDSPNNAISKPILEDFGLTKIKLRLLENPNKYDALSKKVSEKEREREKRFTRITYILTGLIYLCICYILTIHFRKEFDWKLFLMFLALGIMPFANLVLFGIYWLTKKIVEIYIENNVADIDWYEEDGWTWVHLTSTDKENFKRYIIACDEYNHITFEINWNDITYKDGDVEVLIKSRGQIVHYNCNSKSFYSSFKSELQPQFGQVKIEAKDGKYQIGTPEVIEESILIIIRHLDLLEKQRLARIDTLVNSNPEILNARRNQSAIIITIKAQKSDYLNHLLNHQAGNISIIQTMECCAYATGTTDTYERAYVFTVRNSSGRVCVIYENAKDDNASIVAIVDDEEKAYECAAAMVNYMRSHTVNKRETLRSTHQIDEFRVRSINHDDISTWKSNITGDYYVRRTTRHRYRRWRRW